MKQYIEFMEKYSIERRFYCRAYDVARQIEWEIYWNQGNDRRKSWGLKMTTEQEWNWYNGEQLVMLMDRYSIDMPLVESELVATIKSMLVLSSLMTADAEKLLGQDIVSLAMEEHEDFTRALVSAIKNYLPEVEVKDEKKSKREEKVQLRLVTSD